MFYWRRTNLNIKFCGRHNSNTDDPVYIDFSLKNAILKKLMCLAVLLSKHSIFYGISTLHHKHTVINLTNFHIVYKSE